VLQFPAPSSAGGQLQSIAALDTCVVYSAEQGSVGEIKLHYHHRNNTGKSSSGLPESWRSDHPSATIRTPCGNGLGQGTRPLMEEIPQGCCSGGYGIGLLDLVPRKIPKQRLLRKFKSSAGRPGRRVKVGIHRKPKNGKPALRRGTQPPWATVVGPLVSWRQKDNRKNIPA